MDILFFISLSIFLIYNGVINLIYGVPTSLSESYYLLPKRLNNMFYFALLGIAMPLLAFWLDNSAEHYQFLVFLSCASLCFVGCAAAFKKRMTKIVHYTSAIISAIASQICIFITNIDYGLITIGLTLFFIPISLKVMGVNQEKEPNKNTLLYFMEMVCFISIYTTLYFLYIV